VTADYLISDTLIRPGDFDGAFTITDLAATDTLLLVLDGPAARICVFDTTGILLRAFGERGEGPGCLGRPSFMCVLPPRDLLVSDLGSKSLEHFSLEGEWAGRVMEWPGDPVMYLHPLQEGAFAAFQVDWLPGSELRIASSVFACDLAGNRLAVFTSESCLVDPHDPAEALNSSLFAHRLAAGGGRAFVFKRSDPRYVIQCFDPDGVPLYRIEHAVPGARKTCEEMSAEAAQVEDYLRALGGSSDVVQYRYSPRPWREPVADMWVTVDGRSLWALRGDLEGSCFDVYGTLDGAFLHSARAIIDTAGISRVDFFVADSERIYAVLEEDDFGQILVRMRPAGTVTRVPI